MEQPPIRREKETGPDFFAEKITVTGPRRWNVCETDQQSKSHGHDDGADAHPTESEHVEGPSTHPLDQEELFMGRKCGDGLPSVNRRRNIPLRWLI